MKKFMTVLLVVAVMFTFSFGSAFAAAANATQVNYLTAAEDYAKTAVSQIFDTAFDEVAAADQTIGTYPVKAATIVANKDAVKAAVDAQITALTTAEMNNYTVDAAKTTARDVAEAVYGSLMTVNDLKSFITTATTKAGMALVKAQYAKDYDAQVAKFDNINKSVYVDKYASRIDAYIAHEKQEMADKKAALTETSTAADYKGNIDDIALIATTDLEAELIAGTSYESGLYLLKDAAKTEEKGLAAADDKIQTNVEAENAAANAEATAAAVKAEVQKRATAAKTSGTEAEKAQASAYVTVNNAVADAGELKDIAGLKAVGAGTPDWKKKVADVEAFKTWAEKQKAELAANGDSVRAGEAVDKIVAATILDEYCTIAGISAHTASAYPTIADAKAAIAGMSTEKDAKDLEYAKSVRVAALEKACKDAEEDYYPAEYAKVVAKYEDAIAKVNAATTVEGTTTTKVPNPDLSAIAKKAAVDGLLTFTGTTTEAALLQAVADYVAYANTGKDLQDASRINYSAAEAQKIITDMYGNSEARTDAARKALAIDAATVAAKLPTVGGLKDAQAAAKEAIKALPATITVADCAAVKAAFEKDAEYMATTGAVAYPEQATLKADIDALYKAMVKDFAIRSAQLDKNDKAAVTALKDDIAAANELVGTDKLFDKDPSNVSYPAFDATIATNAANAIKDKELAAVKAAVDAIPLNVTEADRATVEAARALYDAYVAEYTDPTVPTDARVGLEAQLASIKAAETLLGITVPSGADAFTDTAAKAYVQDMAIVARSTKLSSGKIKVTVNADVEELIANGYTVKYKFFASTSKKSGYKSKIEKTTKSFTTSGVKGKTNYWKVTVKVYNADGELVAKTPLTQCKYACRTL